MFNVSEPDVIVQSTENIRNLTRNTTSLSEADVDFTSIALFNLISATSADEGFNETVELQVTKTSVIISYMYVLYCA